MIYLTNDNLVLSHVDSNQLQKRTLYQVITVWLNLQSENIIFNRDRQTPRQTLWFKEWSIPNEFSNISWMLMMSYNMTHIYDVRNVEFPNCNNAIQLNFMLEKSQDEHNRIICSFAFVHVQDIQVHYSRNSTISE